MDVWNIIKNRRSIDPELYTGEAIEKIKIEALLEAANWAPTHGFTEPWRFIVYDKNSVSSFGEAKIAHTLLYASINEAIKITYQK